MNEAEQKRLYPMPKPIDLVGRDLIMHQRYRVVVHDCEDVAAAEKAEQISETAACDLETFIAYVDSRTGECLGEVVVQRQFYPRKGAMVPVEEAMA